MADTPVTTQTLQSMKTYYQQRASEYDEWFYRQGRYDRGAEANARWFTEADEVVAALDAFSLTGDVLELAPGTGIWTQRLVQTASMVTAVDAAAEMVEINRAKVSSQRVTYLLADLFTWQPEHTYNAVFFGFWLSHIPLELLDSFLQSVAAMLHPGGKVFFVDGQREQTSTAINHQLPSSDSQVMTRVLNDGRSFEIVKNFYEPADLMLRCKKVGLDVTVHETETYFLYGYGTRS